MEKKKERQKEKKEGTERPRQRYLDQIEDWVDVGSCLEVMVRAFSREGWCLLQ